MKNRTLNGWRYFAVFVDWLLFSPAWLIEIRSSNLIFTIFASFCAFCGQKFLFPVTKGVTAGRHNEKVS